MLRGNDPAASMTVREHVATAIVAAMIGGGKFAGNTPGHVAACALQYADALIAKLSGASATPSRLLEESQ